MTTPASDLARTAGLVLAGGRSSRFGTDKALAQFQGELLLARACRPLRALSACAVSVKLGSAVAVHASEQGMDLVNDDPLAPAGPLSGILAGFDWAHARGFSFLATVPCDAPLLPLDLAPTLLAGRGQARAAYAETSHGVHPLCAVWKTEIRDVLRPILSRGKHPSVRALLAEIGAAPVWFEAADAFANANTRDVLSELERCS
ncbi:MAG: molybdenum cofactor guanylyltransferase [Terricaulis sp.]